MVDFKLLLRPPVTKRIDSLRRRCNVKNVVAVLPYLNGNTRDDCDNLVQGKSDCDIYKGGARRGYFLFGGVVLVLVVVVVVLAFTGVFSGSTEEVALVPPNPTEPLPPSASVMRVFRKAAVCADGVPCAAIGKQILDKNGTAADAAIAALFCNGMFTMQSMGLGGGFLLTYYKRNETKAYTLNARETAPINAKNELYTDAKISQSGPLSIAVPGELKGYVELHKKFGSLPWKELVQPAIELCDKGFNMTKHMYNSLFKNKLYDDPNFNEWFKDENGNLKKEGSLIRPTKLCRTLRLIAENGGDDLYNGTLAKMFLEDAKEIGSLLTAEDMNSYQAKWADPVSFSLRNKNTLYSVPPPGSGALMGYILNILDGYNFNSDSIKDINSTVLTYHRIIEAFKYAYARRTELGDPDFVDVKELLSNLTSDAYADYTRQLISDTQTYNDPNHYGAVFFNKEDHGTAHMSIIDQYGDAVSVTSTINVYFGAGMTSKQTGIIFNNEMDDFSFPHFQNYFGYKGSPHNEMKPGKRPLSSMCPSIIVDENGDVKMVIGASGGSKITTSVAWATIRSLWFGENMKEAVDSPRLHHQLFPMQVEYEYGTLEQIVEGLKAFGHKMKRNSGSVVCAMIRKAEEIIANADYRKGGDVFGM